jgi:CsoR family transcriptional regulator, copper-sensing transcriptional repressor
MAASMLIPTFAAMGLLWAGVATSGALMVPEHAAMLSTRDDVDQPVAERGAPAPLSFWRRSRPSPSFARKLPGSIMWGMLSTETRTETRGYSATKPQLQNRLRRIEGQVRGIQSMVEDDRWCPDILQQIAAIQSALNKVALGLADGHVEHCMAESTDPARREEMSAELMQALGRLVR